MSTAAIAHRRDVAIAAAHIKHQWTTLDTIVELGVEFPSDEAGFTFHGQPARLEHRPYEIGLPYDQRDDAPGIVVLAVGDRHRVVAVNATRRWIDELAAVRDQGQPELDRFIVG